MVAINDCDFWQNELHENQPNKVRETIDLIKEFYLKEDFPIIAYSGGKDSSTVFQLFVLALMEIPAKDRIHTVYLECCDTLLEAPPVKDYITSQLDNIRLQVKMLNLPIEVVELKPDITDTFFVNIIGKGYSAPDPNFRWCTHRLKILPTSRFIEKRKLKGGTIYVVTGARSAESSTRAKTLAKYTLDGKIKTNASQAGSFMFTPIEDWTTEDVWNFLHQQGIFNNEAIEKLYEDSNPNKNVFAGNRIGCWACTVVNNDRALEQFIQNGYRLEPLLKFRAYLKKASYDPDNRHRIRRKGETAYSLFTITARIRLLEQLLLTQQTVGYELISNDELRVIDALWKADQSPLTVKQVINNVRKGIVLTDQQSFNFTTPIKMELKSTAGTINELVDDLWESNHYVEIIADQNGLARIRKGNGNLVSINRHRVWAINEQVEIEYDIRSFNMSVDLFKFWGFNVTDKCDLFASGIVLNNTALMENSFWHISKEADGLFYVAFGVRIPSKFGGIHTKILGIEKGEELSHVILMARERFLANDKVFKVVKQARATLVIDGQANQTILNQAKLDHVVKKDITIPFFMALRSLRTDFIKFTFDPRAVNSMGRLMLRSFAYAYGGFYDIRKRAMSWSLVPAHNIQEFGTIVAISLGDSVVKIELVKSKYKYNRSIIDKYESNRAKEEAEWAAQFGPMQSTFEFAAV
jgi:3''-phosphoadenosine 5''-phosphosulfate sulfotransferase (PAPS reductase)/FAD synthetase and related enzymes